MVADASVWINLVATGSAARILTALAQPVVITDVAFEELDRGRPKGRQAADEVTALLHMGLAEIVQMEAADEGLFLSLVSGPALETLDDGEAATLACAHRLGVCAMIDERKATSLAARRFPHLEVRSTADVLLAAAVRGSFDEAELAEVLFNALIGARMRAPEHLAQEIVRLLGDERAARCLSLPARLRPTRRSRATA